MTVMLLVLTSVAAAVIVDPDMFLDGTIIDNAFTGVTLSAFGSRTGLDGHVYAKRATYTSTYPNVFGNSVWPSGWMGNSLNSSPVWFKAVFDIPAYQVTIDVISDDSSDVTELRAYDRWGVLLDTDLSRALSTGAVETLTVSSPGISYILAGGYGTDIAGLDRLTFTVPEPATVSTFALSGLVTLLRRKRS